MPEFAKDTSVSSDRSRAEIERTLERYGATGFAYGWEGQRAMVGFTIEGRQIRFVVPLPSRDDPEFTRTPSRGTPRSAEQARAAYEQAVRQRWRALALAIKAKLEMVDAKITTIEEEFLAHIVLPNGGTVGQWLAPQLGDVYATGRMPPLLPGPPPE